VLNPEAVDVVREAYWIAIIWVISHESHFVHIRPKTIPVRLAKLVIEEVRNGARDPEKASVSALKVLRAKRLIASPAETSEADISFRDDNSLDSHASAVYQPPFQERVLAPGRRSAHLLRKRGEPTIEAKSVDVTMLRSTRRIWQRRVTRF
jgi:hypothetical protein